MRARTAAAGDSGSLLASSAVPPGGVAASGHVGRHAQAGWHGQLRDRRLASADAHCLPGAPGRVGPSGRTLAARATRRDGAERRRLDLVWDNSAMHRTAEQPWSRRH